MKNADNTVLHLAKKMIFLFITLFFFCSQTNESVMAQEEAEYAVKAAFTFNFVRFTQWPETAFTKETDPYQLCFMGDAGAAGPFIKINGKKNGARAILIRLLSLKDECENCDIVFISRDIDPLAAKNILLTLKGKPILTIGEAKGFTKLGGIINFLSKEDRLRFEINTGTAEGQGLKLSSRLLKLAIIVEGQE